MPRKTTKDLGIGMRIRSLRESRGFTLEDLGAKVDLTWQQVQRIETGRAGLTVERLRVFSKVLGASVADLVGEEDTHADENTRILLFLASINLDEEEIKEVSRYIMRIKNSRD